jgi:regulator of protease activity HflC (stomatin/prohibitin superfamily)
MNNFNIKQKVNNHFKTNSLYYSLFVLIFVLIFALFWNQIVIKIDSGEQGIRWSAFDGTKTDVYKEGYCFISPWDKMYIYNTRLQSKTDTMTILTSEGLSIELVFYYRFYAQIDSIPVIHKRLGPDYESTYVAPEIEAASLSILGNYTPNDLYKISTIVIQSTIKHYVSKQMLERNIIIDDYLIKNIKLPEVVENAIKKKVVAEQLSYEFAYKIKIEEKEKQRKLIEAEGIKIFEETSNLSILKWKGLEVTSEFASSENSKIILIGTSEKDLPILLNTETK